ncbi:MAG: ribonuclease HII [DPANN group archaeon]|nr:ribonuclease HII [DPANN group archaeon]
MRILGIDEAGRGPVFGSLFIGGVLIDDSLNDELKKIGVKDSKLLTNQQRENLYRKVNEMADEVHYVEITASEIDDKRKYMSLNEIEAMKMAECIEMFDQSKIDKVIFDLPEPNGNRFIGKVQKYFDFRQPAIAEHKADVNYPAVSCASIIAKERRERSLKPIYDQFGFFGSGYTHDPRSIELLERLADHAEYPDFVRRSWDTAIQARNRKNQSSLMDFNKSK